VDKLFELMCYQLCHNCVDVINKRKADTKSKQLDNIITFYMHIANASAFDRQYSSCNWCIFSNCSKPFMQWRVQDLTFGDVDFVNGGI